MMLGSLQGVQGLLIMWKECFFMTCLLLMSTGGQLISQDCGGQLTQQSGVISSPNYPDVYPNNKRCQWIITAAKHEIIDLRFSRFDIEGTDNGLNRRCSDYVRVYDGDTIESPLITDMCSVKNASVLAATIIRSSNNKMLVEFYSDNSGQQPGFVANFWSHECPEFKYGNEACNLTCNCVRDKTSYCNSTNGVCVCKPGWTGPDCSQDVDECATRTVETCPNNYQECVNNAGSFTCQCKPGLTKNPLGDCEVNPLAECSAGHGCSHLCVKVQGQEQCYCPDQMKLVGKTCQACSNLQFGKDCRLSCYSCSSTGTASCNPTTGGCVCGQGWTSISCYQDIDECRTLQINVCPDSNQTCINTPGGYQCASKNNHFTLSASSGIIQSPNYPNSAIDVSYSWTIVTQKPHVISFRLSAMSHVSSSYNGIGQVCSYGSLDVYDGSDTNAVLLAQYCKYINSNNQEPVWSSAGTMYIVYRTQDTSANQNFYFNASYKLEDSRVYVSRLTAPSGDIVSQGYPLVPSYNVSFWTITVEAYTFLTLTLSEINLGPGSCEASHLTIFDGKTSGNSSLANYCGIYPNAVNLTSTYQSLSIVYYAGSVDNQKGFKANYISCNCSSLGTSYCPYQGGPCVCKAGYTGTRCESDIDECQLHMCPQYSQCINSQGSFTCYCWNGTQVNPGGLCDEGFTTLTAQSGSFHSQNYPNHYPTYVNYTWIFKGQPSTVVSLKFTDLDLEDSSKCTFDDVTIYDGTSLTQRKQIGQYCGNSIPGLLRTTEDKMRVTFKTDISGSGRGFNVTYYSHVCPLFTYGESECTIPCSCAYDHTQLCDNINGVCFCKPGWGGRGCSQDVDECRNLTACPAHSDCINEPGTYRCECHPGYQNVSGQCQAMSRCSNSIKIPCSHMCAVNTTTGKEQCYCPDDMVLSKNGATCIVALYPHGDTAGDSVVSAKTHISDPIEFSSEVPVGSSLKSVAYAHYNGVIIFSEYDIPGKPDLKVVHIGNENMLAPLWVNNYGVGAVFYHLYESCPFSETSQTEPAPKEQVIMDRLARDLQKYHSLTDFRINLALVVTWKEVQPRTCKSTNTFQSVFVSGYLPGKNQEEEMSFVFFIYEEGDGVCLHGEPFEVGISTDKGVLHDEIAATSNSNTRSTVTLPSDVRTYEVGRNFSASHQCQRYLCQHSDLISSPYFQAETDQLFQCPCNTDLLGLEWELVKEDIKTRCYSISAVAKRRLLQNNQRNKLCCYKWPEPKNSADHPKEKQPGSFSDKSYDLISDPWLGVSTLTSLNPFAYRDAKENMNAETWCCKKQAPQRFCDRFYKTFHSFQCTPYPVFFYASALGDPYIVTLDGFGYPMNGWGEYVMIDVPTENFTLQARTSKVEINGSLSNGTVFTAFAAREGSYAKFQVQLASSNTSMVILANEMDFTNKFYSEVSFSWSSDSLSIKKITENNRAVVAVLFPCGVSMKVRVGVKSLEIDFEVRKSLQNKTRGLLGNFNNDQKDDFILPNNVVLPHNMTERQIFENFGKHYLVTRAKSVFLYNKGESTDDYQHPEFVPLFADEANSVKFNQAKALCGESNIACIYDYIATGGADFAQNTKDSKTAVDNKIENLANTPPTLNVVSPLLKNQWLVQEGQLSFLQLAATDNDGDQVTYELVENVTGVTMFQNGTLSYIPTLNPVSIKIQAKDSKGGYSHLLQVVAIVCPHCSNHGNCKDSEIKSQFLEGEFQILKCRCLPAYTGDQCESELDACLAHPCADGQECTDLTATQQGNSPVGYSCGPCPSGSTKVNGVCEDINECMNTSLCEQECQNTYRSYACYCRPGFRLNTIDPRSCIDIDECEEKSSHCQQQCINTPGNYTCACIDGYTLDGDGRSCFIDTSNLNKCQKCQQVCTVRNNQVSCDCNLGFKVDESNAGRCVDIDECDSQARSPCSQKCVNTIGKFQCACYAGYVLDQDGVTCVECASGKYGENCSSTCNCLGRGVCDKVRGCVCDPSWTGTNCDKDVNECSNSSACADGLVCQNEPGSFRCMCQEGYKLDKGICTDVDECLNYNNRCDLKLEVCVNNVGNYSCQCMEGYTRNTASSSCQDINECEQHIDGCDHICENGPGSYRCLCHQGYRLAGDQRKCEKYKEVCNLNCSHGCSLGDDAKPFCVCPRGYRQVGTNSCQDIDECTSERDNQCSQKDLCVNIPGDYNCSCLPGFRLDNDGRTCVACSGGTWGVGCNRSCSCGKETIRCDAVTGCICKPGSTGERCSEAIDRCASGELVCQENEECVISGGNSVCQCRQGFMWTGGRCQDEDECLNRHSSSQCQQTCINTVGSYRCACYSGYTYNASSNTCHDINECERENHCSQTCINTEGSYRCACRAGQFLQPDGVTCGACANGCTSACNCVEANTASCDTTTGQCVCKQGWTSDDCSVDVDECLTNFCPDYRRCRNLNGSAECVCWNGRQLEDGGLCTDCNRTLTEHTGYLMTSNYPKLYSNNLFCTWTIVSDQEGAVIDFRFQDYDVEGCPYDFAEIYDGSSTRAPILSQVCSDWQRPVRSTGSTMLLVFSSDSSDSQKGFRASYTVILPCKYKSCSHTCQVVSSNPWTEKCTCPEWMKLDPANDQQCVDKHACGSVITDPVGYLVSSKYPELYPLDFNCHWTVQAPLNSVVTLSFSDFSLEKSDDCSFDYVSVYDGSSAASSLLGQFCGKTLPPNITSTGSSMYIVFNSDDSANDWGFKGQYVIHGN